MRDTLQEWKDHFFPSVPPDLDRDFRAYQQRSARRLSVLAAAILLLALPVFQLLELLSDQLGAEVLILHAVMRLPMMVLAMLVIILRFLRPEGPWPRPALLILGFCLILMLLSLLLFNLHRGSDYAMGTSSGLVLAIATTSILATRGARDLLIIYLIPALIFLAGFWWLDISLKDQALTVILPLMAALIGLILAENQYRGIVSQFLLTHHLKRSATTDPLTGLFNRRGTDAILARECAKAKRHGRHFAVLMTDLDHFKKVNDQHGHDVGDEVLQELASRLRATVREEDHVARWGGEEFLVLVQEDHSETVMNIAEKIRKSVAERPFSTRAGRLSVTISLGIACYRENEAAEATISRADKALYQAKNEGRNRVVLASSEQ